MSDASVDQASKREAAGAAAPGWLARGWVDPFTVWVIVAIVTALLSFNYFWTEGRLPTQLIAAGATIALAALLAALTRRLLFATLVTVAVVGAIKLASTLKLAAMNLVLHAYDILFYVTDLPTVWFLLTHYPKEASAIGGALLVTCLVGWLAWRIDGTQVRRAPAFAVALLAALICWSGLVLMGERRHSQFEYEGQYISSFIISWSETIETLAKGQLIDAATGPSQAPRFTLPTSCVTAEKPPHIILIHQESIVPPEYFPQLSYDKSLDPFFRSWDGRLHRMRVETYGGNSVMTEFSLLTGVSTRSFGGMRQFVQSLMAGKIGDTLPQALERCGYRNVMFYPMLRNFVQTARFFAGTGLNEMFDMKDQGARTVNERDRFYYGNALTLMEKHFGQSDKPLFSFIETMATHWPYHVTYWPEETVPGGGPGTYPEMHEYLRRLAFAKGDFDWFAAELKRRFPDQRFVIVQYGDHHPMSTRVYLNYTDGTEAEDVVLPPDSIGYQTYYAVNGINYRPALLPRQEVVDVPYLATLVLEAARLPLSDSHRERRRLLEVCKGRYHDCEKREEILDFHRRLIDSDLIQAR